MKKLLAFVLFLPCAAFAETSVAERPLDAPLNVVSIEAGAFSNYDSSRAAARYMGMGLRYARSVATGLLTESDVLSVEGGAFFYQIVSYAAQGDEYRVLPVNAVAQYSLAWGQIIRPYFYGGLMKNFSYMQRTNGEPASESLSGFLPAVGVGISANSKGVIARVDVGTDLLGAGLAYAF